MFSTLNPPYAIAVFLLVAPCFGDVPAAASRAEQKTSPPQPKNLRGEWLVNEAQLLRSAAEARQVATTIVTDAKKRGLYDDRLFKISGVDREIVLRVPWYLLAIDRYCELNPQVEKFLDAVSLELGEIWVSPQICFVEVYQDNIDALALEKADGSPFPEPSYRRLSELVDDVRKRLKKKAETLDK